MNIFPALRKNERGQSLVELALSLTIILMLLTGAVEFGIGLFEYVTIRDAAQEAALYGSINPTDENGMKQRALAVAADVVPGLQEGDIVITDNNSRRCEGLNGSPLTPNTLTATITFQHPITMPFVTAMIGTNTITLHASVTETILSPVQNADGTCPTP